jgi:hypothetical protein
MKEKITAKSSIEITIEGKTFVLTRAEAKDLRDALNHELGDQANIPYYPPLQPYQPKDNDWQPFVAPTTPIYPSYPQIWCGLSMFPKQESFTASP